MKNELLTLTDAVRGYETLVVLEPNGVSDFLAFSRDAMLESRENPDFLGVQLFFRSWEPKEDDIDQTSQWKLVRDNADRIIRDTRTDYYYMAVPCFKGTGPDYSRWSYASSWVGTKVLNYWWSEYTGEEMLPPGEVIWWEGRQFVESNNSPEGHCDEFIIWDADKRVHCGYFDGYWAPWRNVNWYTRKDALGIFGKNGVTYPIFEEGSYYVLNLNKYDKMPDKAPEGVWRHRELNGIGVWNWPNGRGHYLMDDTLTLFSQTHLSVRDGDVYPMKGWPFGVFVTDDKYVLEAYKTLYPGRVHKTTREGAYGIRDGKEQLGHPCLIRLPATPDEILKDPRFTLRNSGHCRTMYSEYSRDNCYSLWLGEKRFMRQLQGGSNDSPESWLSRFAGKLKVVNLTSGEMALCSDLIEHRFSDLSFAPPDEKEDPGEPVECDAEHE